MRLSKVLIEYRKRMRISQRQFARQCHLSNSYISFLENEMNPRTGKPLTPTLQQYKNLASGMGYTVQQLWTLLDDDSPVILDSTINSYDFLSDEEYVLINAYRDADDRAREDALKMLLNHPLKSNRNSSE